MTSGVNIEDRDGLRKLRLSERKRALQFSELGRDMDMEMVKTQGSDTVQVSHK